MLISNPLAAPPSRSCADAAQECEKVPASSAYENVFRYRVAPVLNVKGGQRRLLWTIGLRPDGSLQVQDDGEVLSANPKWAEVLLNVLERHVGRRRSRTLSSACRRALLRVFGFSDRLPLSHGVSG